MVHIKPPAPVFFDLEKSKIQKKEIDKSKQKLSYKILNIFFLSSFTKTGQLDKKLNNNVNIYIRNLKDRIDYYDSKLNKENANELEEKIIGLHREVFSLQGLEIQKNKCNKLCESVDNLQNRVRNPDHPPMPPSRKGRPNLSHSDYQIGLPQRKITIHTDLASEICDLEVKFNNSIPIAQDFLKKIGKIEKKDNIVQYHLELLNNLSSISLFDRAINEKDPAKKLNILIEDYVSPEFGDYYESLGKLATFDVEKLRNFKLFNLRFQIDNENIGFHDMATKYQLLFTQRLTRHLDHIKNIIKMDNIPKENKDLLREVQQRLDDFIKSVNENIEKVG